MIEIAPMELLTYAAVIGVCGFLSGYYWGFRAGWKAWKKRGVPPEDQ